MIAVLIFCTIVSLLCTATAAWCLQTVTDLSRAATRGRDSLEAGMKTHRTLTTRMETRLDNLAARVEDHIAGLEPPAAVKAPARKRAAPAPKKGTTR